MNRRIFLAPPLPMHRGQKHHDDLNKLLPTLDMGSHSNAAAQPLPEAAARDERTLEAVGRSTGLGEGFGTNTGPTYGCRPGATRHPDSAPDCAATLTRMLSLHQSWDGLVKWQFLGTPLA
jgi:hypothetical protein